jgi:hypothetical protein
MLLVRLITTLLRLLLEVLVVRRWRTVLALLLLLGKCQKRAILYDRRRMVLVLLLLRKRCQK